MSKSGFDPVNWDDNSELAQTCIAAIEEFGPQAMVAVQWNGSMAEHPAAKILCQCWYRRDKFEKELQPMPQGSGETGSASLPLPPLTGRWRYNQGYMCCGTIRVFRQDIDTNPSEEMKAEIFGWMAEVLNAASQAPQAPAGGAETMLTDIDRMIGACTVVDRAGGEMAPDAVREILQRVRAAIAAHPATGEA